MPRARRHSPSGGPRAPPPPLQAPSVTVGAATRSSAQIQQQPPATCVDRRGQDGSTRRASGPPIGAHRTEGYQTRQGSIPQPAEAAGRGGGGAAAVLSHAKPTPSGSACSPRLTDRRGPFRVVAAFVRMAWERAARSREPAALLSTDTAHHTAHCGCQLAPQIE